jgi:hypothetical protein
MIDLVRQYHGIPKPSLHTEVSTCYSKERYLLDENNDTWPAIYIIEGLGQSFLLLSIFFIIESEFGINVSQDENQIQRILDLLDSGGQIPKQYQNNGLLAHVDLKQYREVKVGQKIDYTIDLNMNQGKLFRYKVEAKVESKTVFDGFMIGSQF